MPRTIQIKVKQDGMWVASVFALRSDAEREARHYAMIYGQDGPVEVWEGRERPKRRHDLEPRPLTPSRVQFSSIIAPIVEGQIRTFAAAHPAVVESVDWRYSHANKTDAFVSSVAKRITRALTCPETEARLRSALSGQIPDGERPLHPAELTTAHGKGGGNHETAAHTPSEQGG